MASIRAVYDRFCEIRFPLPTEQEIVNLENELKIRFPGEFRDYLQEFNGGYFRDAKIILPEPITVEWRDGLVTHTEDDLRSMYGFHATLPQGELAKPINQHWFEDNNMELLPIGYTSVGCMVLLDFLPEYFGNILLKFPSAGAYTVADGIAEFFDLIECVDG